VTYDEFLERLTLEYPKTAQEHDLRSLVIPSLVAPVALKLPVQLKNEAERLVSLFHGQVRENLAVASQLLKIPPALPDWNQETGTASSDDPSVLMSYDFHIDYEGRSPQENPGHLKLIEINTNASMSLLTDIMICRQGIAGCLKEKFMIDFAEALGRPLSGTRVVITDEEPEKQKLFVEFLLYKELFEKCGAEVRIVDRARLEMRDGKLWADSFGPIDLVYNRTTDFYFEEPQSKALNEAFRTRSCVITPNPYDYRLLADKNRLVEWSRDGIFESYGISSDDSAFLRSAVLRTREVGELDPDALWAERKKLMFKPRNAYGGKGVYRGSSISRGAFQEMLLSDSLAQDFVPAPTVRLVNPTGEETEFKYDLRFFAFRDQVRIACARIYQGQMTNATTPGGGLAAIIWT
jgi:hypothetical protein